MAVSKLGITAGAGSLRENSEESIANLKPMLKANHIRKQTNQNKVFDIKLNHPITLQLLLHNAMFSM